MTGETVRECGGCGDEAEGARRCAGNEGGTVRECGGCGDERDGGRE